ncbi:MAG: Major facilitator superfamily (MFS_1) transporter [uncultured bacterium]|nr:MAG: Major facilitator superfamily (MFS_1) transporter [uncultured bacterium]
MIKESKVTSQIPELDWQSMVLLALTMGGIVLSLIRSEAYGWHDSLTLFYVVIAIIAAVFLIKVERKQKNPLIEFADFSQLLFCAGAMLCFLSGVLSAVALFFDPLYLEIIRDQSPEVSGLILFAIPIAVFVTAFIVGWLISSLGIIPTILVGLSMACLASLLQIFFTNMISVSYVIVAFVCLGATWAMGNTVSIIAAQQAVSPGRASVATGTVVTMFNVGGSIGLAIAVVIYHAVAFSSLTHIFQSSATKLNTAQFDQVAGLIINPAHSLEAPLGGVIHYLFREAFMDGFSGVMWFLLIISSGIFLSILIWKLRIAKRSRLF